MRALLFAFLAELDSAKSADDTDEGSAVRARVAFRRALLIPAGAADHRIAFTKNLAHISSILFRDPGV
jgi:hypothetical protein